MKTCPKCKASLSADATICQLCFTSLVAPVAAAPVTAVPVAAGAGPVSIAASDPWDSVRTPSPTIDWVTVTIWILAAIWIFDGVLQAVPGLLVEFKARALGIMGRGAFPTTVGIVYICVGLGLIFGQGWGYGLAKLISFLRIAACFFLIPVVLTVAPIFIVYPIAGIAFSLFQLWILYKAN